MNVGPKEKVFHFDKTFRKKKKPKTLSYLVLKKKDYVLGSKKLKA